MVVIREMILWEFSIWVLNDDKNLILPYDVRYVSFAAFGLSNVASDRLAVGSAFILNILMVFVAVV